ncbi:MAG: hypothetical protein M3Y72_09665 [Acidobacteriota bacterium]|nr:hypothetical protein [Acidobacteriota bacterium]
MPDSIDVLRRLGVAIPAEAGFRFRGIRFCDAHSSVAADFPNGMGVGLRRPALHSLLTRRAEETGAKLVWNAKHIRLAQRTVSVNGQCLRPKLIVAADGQNSLLRRQGRLIALLRNIGVTVFAGITASHRGPHIWNCTGARDARSTSRLSHPMRFV